MSTESRERKEKRMKKNEQSLRDLWDAVKHTNMHNASLRRRR